MRFGLIIRGQYPQGDDMRVRLKEDLDAAKFAEDLGYDVIGKGSHYSSYPFQYSTAAHNRRAEHDDASWSWPLRASPRWRWPRSRRGRMRTWTSWKLSDLAPCGENGTQTRTFLTIIP